MRVLSGFTPHLEIYSIDEAFLGLSGFEARLETHARELRQTVLQWTGIPVSVGIAPTKTLAKVANRIAKKDAASGGVRCLLDEAAQREALAKLELTDPWGIARRLGARLSAIGITTPLELRDADHRLMRERFSVVLERMVLELRGVACIALEEVTPDRKSLIASRSFGQPVETRRGLEEAVSVYTARAAEKMRRQNLATALANRRHRPCPSVVRPLRAGGPEVFEGGSFSGRPRFGKPLASRSSRRPAVFVGGTSSFRRLWRLRWLLRPSFWRSGCVDGGRRCEDAPMVQIAKTHHRASGAGASAGVSREAVSNLNQCSRVGTDRDGAVSCGSKTLPWTAGMRKQRSLPNGTANGSSRPLRTTDFLHERHNCAQKRSLPGAR